MHCLAYSESITVFYCLSEIKNGVDDDDGSVPNSRRHFSCCLVGQSDRYQTAVSNHIRRRRRRVSGFTLIGSPTLEMFFSHPKTFR